MKNKILNSSWFNFPNIFTKMYWFQFILIFVRLYMFYEFLDGTLTSLPVLLAAMCIYQFSQLIIFFFSCVYFKYSSAYFQTIFACLCILTNFLVHILLVLSDEVYVFFYTFSNAWTNEAPHISMRMHNLYTIIVLSP